VTVVKFDDRGYAADVECGFRHAGSHRLAEMSMDAPLECEGCAHYYSRADVASAQRGKLACSQSYAALFGGVVTK
jgi:hypothetical protein